MKQVLYPFIKWGARISIVGFVFLPSLFYTAFRIGLLPSMAHPQCQADQILSDLMRLPITAVLLKVGIIAISILVSFIEIQVTHGHRAADLIGNSLRSLCSTAHFSIPLAAFCFYFLANNSIFNGPLVALLIIPTVWFIGIVFIPDPEDWD